jgi:hypothetical protein
MNPPRSPRCSITSKKKQGIEHLKKESRSAARRAWQLSRFSSITMGMMYLLDLRRDAVIVGVRPSQNLARCFPSPVKHKCCLV